MKKTYIAAAALALAALSACDDKTYTLDMPEHQLITGIELNVNPELPLLVGTDSLISFTVTPEVRDVDGLLWKSANELVATVDADGRIHALSVGKTTVTVTPAVGFGNDQTTRAITVSVIPEVKKVTQIDFLTAEREVYVDDKLPLEVKLWPVDHTYDHLLWSSSDPAVATVDENGVVTGVTPGNVSITAATHDGGNARASVALTVRKSEPATDVMILPYDLPLYFKQPLRLDFTTVPATATKATVQWSSSDEQVLSVKDGVVIAENFGTATITATCPNGNSSSIELTVDPGFYVWDASNNFEQWSINGGLGKFVIKDGLMNCTVTDDANARIYIQRAYSTAKNLMDFNFAKYPVIALVTDAEAKGATVAINLANIGNTVNVGKNVTKEDLPDGRVLMYYDCSALTAFNDDNGLVAIRAFMFKITKSPVANFNIHWIRVFESADQMREYAASH